MSEENLEKIDIRSFELLDLDRIKKFTDDWIGLNYFSVEDLKTIQLQSCFNGLNASLVAYAGEQIVGVRLSLAPASWIDADMKLSTYLWQVDAGSVGYFKSLFIHKDYRNSGLGTKMSAESEQILRKMGANAILTHSWLESPNNSSQKYLQSFKFIELARIPKFWNHIDYLCVHCTPNPCQCTAVEMIKYISS